MQKSKTKDLNREHIEKFQKAQRLQQTGHLNEAEKPIKKYLQIFQIIRIAYIF